MKWLCGGRRTCTYRRGRENEWHIRQPLSQARAPCRSVCEDITAHCVDTSWPCWLPSISMCHRFLDLYIEWLERVRSERCICWLYLCSGPRQPYQSVSRLYLKQHQPSSMRLVCDPLTLCCYGVTLCCGELGCPSKALQHSLMLLTFGHGTPSATTINGSS